MIIPEANPIMALEIVIDSDKNASDGYSFPIYFSNSPSKAPGTKPVSYTHLRAHETS